MYHTGSTRVKFLTVPEAVLVKTYRLEYVIISTKNDFIFCSPMTGDEHRQITETKKKHVST